MFIEHLRARRCTRHCIFSDEGNVVVVCCSLVGKSNSTRVNKQIHMQLKLVVSTMVEVKRYLLRCEETGFGKAEAETSFRNSGASLCCSPWIRMWPYKKFGSRYEESNV